MCYCFFLKVIAFFLKKSVHQVSYNLDGLISITIHLQMLSAANDVFEELASMDEFVEGENLWFNVYDGENHAPQAFYDRIWNILGIINA